MGETAFSTSRNAGGHLAGFMAKAALPSLDAAPATVHPAVMTPTPGRPRESPGQPVARSPAMQDRLSPPDAGHRREPGTARFRRG